MLTTEAKLAVINMLDYLRRKDIERYRSLIERLGLRK